MAPSAGARSNFITSTAATLVGALGSGSATTDADDAAAATDADDAAAVPAIAALEV
jgi:hypothetical protein